jgi:serine/threonine-protein kinase
LGQGGFGAVYRAEDLSLHTICALKENLDYWDEAQRQFEREARMLAGIRHPNLPRVIDYFIIPAQGQYLAMDYIEGYDLQTVIERVKQPLVEKRVLEWIDQICDALAFCTGNPAHHRDIKPANIRITSSGKAVWLTSASLKPTNQASNHCGARAVTAGYLPSNNTAMAHGYTRRSVFPSATLYTLLTGRQPPESIAHHG